jgi:PAS domain S-box-containing protein
METDRHDHAYRLLFEHNPLPMWVFDRETLRFLEVNEAAVRQYGFDRDEFLAMTIRDIRPPEDLANLEADLERRKDGYDPPAEWRHRRKDGEILYVDVAAHDVEHRGRPARLVLARDITARKNAEAEQERLRDELEHHAATLETKVAERTRALAEMNAELEAFAYSVSHDLRAPLRAMQGFSQALIEDYSSELGDEGQRYARIIVDSARRMDEMIRDILAYSRVSQGEMILQPLSLDVVVEAARSQLAAVLTERGAEVQVEKPLGTVVAHPGTLVQVLANLVSNAAKFVPAERAPVVRIDSRESDGEIRLRIQDNGIGIEPEYQERIFRVFERLHSIQKYGGSGIGLSIVRKGVERMGGRVALESTPGEGSTFTVVLPAAG